MGTPDEGVLERVVEVTGVTNNLNKDTLRDFFEIEKRSGGKDVQRLVTLPKWEMAWVKFPTAEVAMKVMLKGAEPTPFKVVETKLGVSKVSVLVVSHVTPDEESMVTDYFKTKRKRFWPYVERYFYAQDNEALYIQFNNVNALKEVLSQKHTLGKRILDFMLPTEVDFAPQTTYEQGEESDQKQFDSMREWGQSADLSQRPYSSMFNTSSVSKPAPSHRRVETSMHKNNSKKSLQEDDLGAKPKVQKDVEEKRSADNVIMKHSDENFDDVFDVVTVTVNVEFLPKITKELDDFRRCMKNNHGISFSTDEDGKHCLKGPFDEVHKIGKALASGKFHRFQSTSAEIQTQLKHRNEKDSKNRKDRNDQESLDKNVLKFQTNQPDEINRKTENKRQNESKHAPDSKISKQEEPPLTKYTPESQNIIPSKCFPVDPLCWKFFYKKNNGIILNIQTKFSVTITDFLDEKDPYVRVSGTKAVEAKTNIYTEYENMKKVVVLEKVFIKSQHPLVRLEEEVYKTGELFENFCILDLVDENNITIIAVDEVKCMEVKEELFSNLGINEKHFQMQHDPDKSDNKDASNTIAAASSEIQTSNAILSVRDKIKETLIQGDSKFTEPADTQPTSSGQTFHEADGTNTQISVFAIIPLSWKLYRALNIHCISDIESKFKVSVKESFEGTPRVQIQGKKSEMAKQELKNEYWNKAASFKYNDIDLRQRHISSVKVNEAITKINDKFYQIALAELQKETGTMEIVALDQTFCNQAKFLALECLKSSYDVKPLAEKNVMQENDNAKAKHDPHEGATPQKLPGHVKKIHSDASSSTEDHPVPIPEKTQAIQGQEPQSHVESNAVEAEELKSEIGITKKVISERTAAPVPESRAFFRMTFTNGLVVDNLQGDITKVAVDLIVNPTDENLLNLHGISRVISTAAGSKMELQCLGFKRDHGKCNVSDVLVTEAGDLKAHAVLHAVVPQWDERCDGTKFESELDATLFNSLLKANDHKANCIAVPVFYFDPVPSLIQAKTFYKLLEKFDDKMRHPALKTVLFVSPNEEVNKNVSFVFENKGQIKSSQLTYRHEEIQGSENEDVVRDEDPVAINKADREEEKSERRSKNVVVTDSSRDSGEEKKMEDTGAEDAHDPAQGVISESSEEDEEYDSSMDGNQIRQAHKKGRNATRLGNKLMKLHGNKCYVCSGDIREDNKILLRKCKHAFCRTCIRKQFREKGAECPICGEKYRRRDDPSQNPVSPVTEQPRHDNKDQLRKSTAV